MLLGALILDPDRLAEARETLRLEDFEAPQHRKAFEAILAIDDARAGVDLCSVVTWLAADATARALAPDGGWAYWLADAEQSVTSSAFVPRNVRIVSDAAMLRASSAALRLQADRSSEVHPGIGDEVQAFLEQTEAIAFDLARRSLGRTMIHELSGVASEVVAGMDQPEQGVPTGVADLDELLFGLRKGELVILAARPGRGKTALALQVSLNVARKECSVLFLSLEMSRIDLGQRILANLAGIEHARIRSGRLDAADRAAIQQARNTVSTLRLGLIEDNATTCARLKSLGRRRASKVGLDLVVVDYLQLMSHPGCKDRFQEVGAISRGLKMLARELEVPVLAVSQLSRAGDEGRPRLAHLRESGALEQDADVVLMLWTEDEDGPLHCAIEKNRHGRTGKTCLAFRREFHQIAGLARAEVSFV